MRKSLKETIMARDGHTSEEADSLIKEATDALFEYIEVSDNDSAENVCEEYFGLEPDYVEDLI